MAITNQVLRSKGKEENKSKEKRRRRSLRRRKMGFKGCPFVLQIQISQKLEKKMGYFCAGDSNYVYQWFFGTTVARTWPQLSGLILWWNQTNAVQGPRSSFCNTDICIYVQHKNIWKSLTLTCLLIMTGTCTCSAEKCAQYGLLKTGKKLEGKGLSYIEIDSAYFACK